MYNKNLMVPGAINPDSSVTSVVKLLRIKINAFNTIALLTFCLFLLVSAESFAGAFRGTCKMCVPPERGWYNYTYDKNGKPITVFTGDGENGTKVERNGHGTFLIPEGSEEDGPMFDCNKGANGIDVMSGTYLFAYIYVEGEENPVDSALIVGDESKKTIGLDIPADFISRIDFWDTNKTEILITVYGFKPVQWILPYNITITENSLTFSTDLEDIYIKVVDITTGKEVINYTSVNAIATIDISNFTVGCKYSLIVSQKGDKTFEAFENYNFCK